jgi:aryl-alcohol dehydrogenase-like predicted oxidoreductase
MQAGLLTGAFSAERAASLDRGDWRSRDEEFTGQALTRNLELSAALQPVADRHGVSRGAVAIAWAATCPEVTGAIGDGRTPVQVEGWLSAGGLSLTQADLAEIAAAAQAIGAGDGPAPPGR